MLISNPYLCLKDATASSQPGILQWLMKHLFPSPRLGGEAKSSSH